MYLGDMGHIADRRWRQTYESPIVSWTESRGSGKLSVAADCPQQGSLTMEIRQARDRAALAESPWQPLAGEKFDVETDAHCLQYRATFVSRNGDAFPVLHRVDIEVLN